jgi:hypothetical protein
MESKEVLINSLSSYYEMVSSLILGIDYIKKNQGSKKLNETMPRYIAKANNVAAMYKNIQNLKKEFKLPMFNFNDLQKGNICLQQGRLVGDITKAREEADAYVVKHIKDIDNITKEANCMEYELGLLVHNLCEHIKEDYIEPLYEDKKEENTESDNEEETKENNIEKNEDDIVFKTIEIDTKITGATELSMFSLLQN